MYNPTFIGEIDLNEDTLAHYGVKGMRWGRRRETKEEAKSRRKKEGARRKVKKGLAKGKSATEKAKALVNGYYETGKTDMLHRPYNGLGLQSSGDEHGRVRANSSGRTGLYTQVYNNEARREKKKRKK